MNKSKQKHNLGYDRALNKLIADAHLQYTMALIHNFIEHLVHTQFPEHNYDFG